ncbi:hypothetical protein NPJ82_02575 [Sphingomonas sp. NY01]|uniref:hypothetical protein n=1 Tax=Sphingomonas sp. NY01 TaxID=2968057 RepID=UPI00315C783F
MLDFIVNNWLTIVGLLIGGLISWLITWIYFKKGERTKALSYTTSDVAVVWPENPDEDDALKITYHGREVPRVTSTTIAIWNSGTETIDGDDILADEPLTLHMADGVQILRVQVLERTRDIIIGDIPGIDSHKAIVRFRYLDAKDGAAFEVLHTGGLDALTVSGAIKGIPQGVKPLDREHFDRWMIRFFRFVLAPMFLIILIPMLALPAVGAYHALSKPWPANIISAGSYLLLYVLLIYAARSGWKMDSETGPQRISGVPDKLAAKLGRRIMLMGSRHLPDNRMATCPKEIKHP